MPLIRQAGHPIVNRTGSIVLYDKYVPRWSPSPLSTRGSGTLPGSREGGPGRQPDHHLRQRQRVGSGLGSRGLGVIERVLTVSRAVSEIVQHAQARITRIEAENQKLCRIAPEVQAKSRHQHLAGLGRYVRLGEETWARIAAEHAPALSRPTAPSCVDRFSYR